MSGAELTRRSCPNCGAAIDAISDCFTGAAEHLDNFDEVEEALREQDLVSNDEYDMYGDQYSREEYENAIASTDRDRPDGPFIIDSIVTEEAWCTSCDFSERTYTPPLSVTRDDKDPIEPADLDNISDEIKAQAEALLDEMRSHSD